VKKTLAVLNVLLIASVLAFADLHPTPPPHPDAVPDPTSPLPTEVHPDYQNYTPSGGSTPVTSVYDDATVVWTFNDPTDLGADNGDGTYDLTLVNTPTATGGALGYAADFELGNFSYSYIADNATLSAGDRDFSYIVFVRPEQVAQSYVLGKSSNDTGASFELGIREEADGTVDIVVGDGSTLYNPRVSSTDTLTTGVIGMVYAYHDSVNNLVGVSINNGTAVTQAHTTGIADTTGAFAIASRRQLASGTYDGVIGPVLRYNSIPASSVVTSVYNSGKGKLCGDLTAAEKVGLVACWNMTEDGGPYADSIGSNTLTGVNTPTRAAGLVEQSDSGMGVRTVGASSSHLISTAAGLDLQGSDYTYVTWVNTDWTTGYIGGGTYGADFWLIGNSALGAVTGYHYTTVANCTTTATANGALAKNTWTMVAMWFSSTDNKAYIELNANGTIKDTGSCNPGPLPNAYQNFKVGWNSTASMTGSHDNSALWKRVLTSDERSELYNSGAGDFYAAFWDAYFSGDPIRFAWSARPEIRRMN